LAVNVTDQAQSTDPAAPRRGRPRNAEIEQAILRATVQLLDERGFDRFTVQDIADRAGTGLGAIYRRWPTKLDVVVSAVRTVSDDAPPAVTGDVEHDLAEVLESRVRVLRGCLGAIIPGLLSSMHDHPDLAALVNEASIKPGLAKIRAVLAPAIPDPAELELRTEMAQALLQYRLLVTGTLPTRREIKRQLVPVILGRSPTKSPRRPSRTTLA
jgi:AcrR family transcriptional regulator